MHSGVHGTFLQVLRSMSGKLKSCARTQEGLTEFFTCNIGIRQGCMISPFLFVLYVDELVNVLNRGCEGI